MTRIILAIVPYNSAIIAHEKMGAYAYISILDISLKLAVAYAIMLSPYDRLSSYGVLLLLEALIIRLISILEEMECRLIRLSMMHIL